MPRGPKGQWRPPHPIACAMHVGRILTGEIEETFEPPKEAEDAPDPAAGDRTQGEEAGPERPPKGETE